MSKRCDLRCTVCNVSANLVEANWAHRELDAIVKAAQCEPTLLPAYRRFAELGVTVHPDWQGYAVWFCNMHARHLHAVRVEDEYGAVWPCECRGDHTGPCRL